MTLAGTALLAALFLVTMGAPSASADIAQYSLTVGNTAISSFPGPYGTVDVNRTSATMATITFTADPGFKLGDSGPGQQGFGVNVNAGSWTVSGVLPATYTDSGAGALDAEIGSFNQTFYHKGGFPVSVTTFSFNVTAVAGTNWTQASQVLVADSGGTRGNFAVAAHVFVCGQPAGTACTSATNTGSAGGTPSVPDGGMTLMLLGGALVGLETLRRKFRV
jgi:hypothetical protein